MIGITRPSNILCATVRGVHLVKISLRNVNAVGLSGPYLVTVGKCSVFQILQKRRSLKACRSCPLMMSNMVLASILLQFQVESKETLLHAAFYDN